jgi:molecular chaperone DnaJ
VVVRQHPVFRREGYDVYSTVPITVSTADLGGHVDVQTLYGDVELKVDAGVDLSVKKRLSKYGVPNLPPNGSKKGNHYVDFMLQIPKKMSADERAIYQELLAIENGDDVAVPDESEDSSIFSKFKTFVS